MIEKIQIFPRHNNNDMPAKAYVNVNGRSMVIPFILKSRKLSDEILLEVEPVETVFHEIELELERVVSLFLREFSGLIFARVALGDYRPMLFDEEIKEIGRKHEFEGNQKGDGPAGPSQSD